MGKRGTQMWKGVQMGNTGKGRYDAVNDDDYIAVPILPRPKTLFDYIHQLEHKKASVREDGLLAIIGIFNDGNEYNSLQKYFATCLFQVLGCLKKGLAKEKQLASQVLGLIAIKLSETDNAQEIYRETISLVSEVLPNKRLEPCASVALLESLAIVTSFCANNSTKTQAAMQVIWGFMFSNSKQSVPTSQASATASPLIYAWLFLLTKVNRWEITYKYWQGAISHFLALLEDDTTCVAAGEALALIFDCDNIDKFYSETENSTGKAKSYSRLKQYIKDIVLKQLQNASLKARAALPLKQFFNNAARADWDVLMYFEDDKCPQYSERFDGQKLTLSSWSSIIQLKFLKNFLGEEEFSKHMLENELFQQLFEFTPYYEEDDTACLYESTMEKIEANLYLPGEQDLDTLTSRKELKQERQLRRSIVNKSKTKMLNKRRTFAEERKGKTYSIESEL